MVITAVEVLSAEDLADVALDYVEDLPSPSLRSLRDKPRLSPELDGPTALVPHGVLAG